MGLACQFGEHFPECSAVVITGHTQVASPWVISGILCVCKHGYCVCARVRVCIHALTWVTAQLRCLTRSSSSSDCIVHLDLNFILAKKKIIIIKKLRKHTKKVAGTTGWNAFLRKTVQSDAPWVVSTDFYLGLHLERQQTVKWEDVNKEERRAKC